MCKFKEGHFYATTTDNISSNNVWVCEKRRNNRLQIRDKKTHIRMCVQIRYSKKLEDEFFITASGYCFASFLSKGLRVMRLYSNRQTP